MGPNSDRSNFERGLDILRRRWPWILACCILATAAAFGLSKHKVKKYTATASLSFKNSQLAQQIAGLQTTGLSVQSEQDSNVKLVQVGDMAAKTASQLGHGLTEQKVVESLSIAQQGETDVVGESSIVDVSASTTSPVLAAQIATTYAEQFVAEQQESSHHYFTTALADVTKQLAALGPQQRLSAAGVDLQDRAQELTLLSDLQYGGVQLAQRAAVPTDPSSPGVSRDTLIGFVLGLLVGLGVALLLERLDRRIREPKELERLYDSPLLGVVPESAPLARAAPPASEAQIDLPPAEAETFNLIAAHLRSFNAGREIRAVLVTAAAPGEGTTAIAFHLAQAAAMAGSRTLLLETDFRSPTLTHHARIQPRPGLRDVLTDSVSLDDAIQSLDLRGAPMDRSKGPALDILVSGATNLPHPGELTKSHAMQTALDRMLSTYDLIVIDTPSLMTVSDAFPILHHVDGVVVVGQIGRDRRDTAEQFKEILDRSAVPLLGVVANRFGSGSRVQAYDYDDHKNEPTATVTPQDQPSSSDETRSLTRTSA